MGVVVADTGPLQYLILIDAVEVLSKLFSVILISDVVQAELGHVRTPQKVRQWLAQRPIWLDVRAADPSSDLPFSQLGPGERSAIALAQKEHADLVLMDDRAGVAVARAEGLSVMGTLGTLDLAARHGLLNLVDAFAALQKTNFRCRKSLFDQILAESETGRLRS